MNSIRFLLCGVAIVAASVTVLSLSRPGAGGNIAQLAPTATSPLSSPSRPEHESRRADESEEEEEEEGHDSPGEAMEFRYRQRLSENGAVPANALMLAKADREATLAAFSPRDGGISQGAWTAIGPGNIGGRIRAILIHPTQPNTLWIGSASGGIWKTTDAGASWHALDDFLPSLAVGCMVMDPNDPDTLYAGTGEGFTNADNLPGAGIFKSTNGGATWIQLAGTIPAGDPTIHNWGYVNRIAMHPANSSIMLAATRRGLFHSTDAGATWTQRLIGDARDVRFSPQNGLRSVASDANGTALYSADGGVTWSNATGIPGGGRIELAFAPLVGNTVYASVERNGGELYMSLDVGQTYTLMNTGSNYLMSQGWYDNCIWVDPTNSQTVIVGGVDLWRSTNQGALLSRISRWQDSPTSAHADHHIMVSHPGFNGTTNKTVYFGNDGGIYRTTDVYAVSESSGWEVLNNGLAITQFYGGAGNTTSATIIGGTQDNGTLRYSGDQEGWIEYAGGDGGFCAADPTDSRYLYGEYVYLRLHRSKNGGNSQSVITAGLTDAGDSDLTNFIAPFILDPNNPNIMLAGGDRLWRSNSIRSDPNWHPIAGSVLSHISAIAVQPGDSNIIWIGHNSGRIRRSIDGAAAAPHFNPIAALPTLPDRYCTRIGVDPHVANRVYFAFSGYACDNLWRSTDDGATAVLAVGPGPCPGGVGRLPRAPVNAIAFHPTIPDHIYVGTDVGVFGSADGGDNWSTQNDGPANTEVADLFWMNGTTLVAVTHGRGMFTTRLDDCNTNMTLDSIDIPLGNSIDCDSNGTPDECEIDCNTNGTLDSCETADLGACCRADGSCARTLQVCCAAADEAFTLGESCAPLGVCCLADHTCTVTTAQCCENAGGEFPTGQFEPGSVCGVMGACKLGDECVNTTEACCDAADGTFVENETCESIACSITKGFTASQPGWQSHNPLARHRTGGPGEGEPQPESGVQASLDGAGVLTITGTSGDDSIRVAIDPNNVAVLAIYVPVASNAPMFQFNIGGITTIAINSGDGNDLLAMDDANGTLSDVAPMQINTGNGDDVFIGGTGSLSVQNVIDLLDVLQTSRDLLSHADALIALMGAQSPVGGGVDDTLTDVVNLVRRAHTDFVSPAGQFVRSVHGTLILPVADEIENTRDGLLTQAGDLIKRANTDIAEAAMQLSADADRDLVTGARALADQARALRDRAINMQADADMKLSNPGASNLQAQLDAIAAQLTDALLDPCIAAEDANTSNTNDVCPHVEDLLDCMEALVDDFEAMGVRCETALDGLANDAEALSEPALEASGDQYEMRGDNLDMAGDAVVAQADLLVMFAENYAAQVESRLQNAGDALMAAAQTQFIDGGAAYSDDAIATLNNRQQQLTDEAALLVFELQQLMATANDILDTGMQPIIGPSGGCQNIQPTNTITGGPGASVLLGTTGSDLIHGNGGLDLIIGWGGDDQLFGDDGFDVVFGGSGTNEIHGGNGVDILVGGGGTDCIFGDDGLDVIVGLDGDDELDGGNYVDLMIGDNGDDNMKGGDGIDLLIGDLELLGETGSDHMDGGNCIDVLIGGPDSDTMIGGPGQTLSIGNNFSIALGNLLFGGPGNDVMHGGSEDGNTNGIDVMLGGVGNDQMHGGNGGKLVIGDFDFMLGNVMFGGQGMDTMTAKDGVDVMFGGDQDDTMTGRKGASLQFSDGDFNIELGDVMFGNAGRDTLHGDDTGTNRDGDDIDFMFGNDGNDTLNGYDGGDLTINDFTIKIGNMMFGGDGNDTITATKGIDLAFGNNDNDTIQCGAGDIISNDDQTFFLVMGDLIFGGQGRDRLSGDAPRPSSAELTDGIDVIFGGEGNDEIFGGAGGTVAYIGSSIPIYFVWGNFLFGNDGGDVIYGDYEPVNPNNPDPNDRKRGIDVIFGGEGADDIDAGPGSVMLIAPNGSGIVMNMGNIIFGGPGDDEIDGADDSFDPDSSQLYWILGGGLDLVFGGAGDDLIRTHNGMDFVFGNDGVDDMQLGEGGFVGLILPNPPYFLPLPLGNLGFGNDDRDTITSAGRILPLPEVVVVFGNQCGDTINLSGKAVNVAFGNLDDDDIHHTATFTDILSVNIMLGGPGQDTIDTGVGLLNIAFGGRHRDTINSGVAISNILFGNRGPDQITGSPLSALTLIFGGDDPDTIDAGGGAVTLASIAFGGKGRDDLRAGNAIINVMFGGAHDDYINGAPGVELLFGNGGADVIDAGGGLFNVAFGNSGNDEINGSGGANIYFGNSGDDTLRGHGLVNLLCGNGDNDKLFGGGATLMLGGPGADVIVGGGGPDVALGGAQNDIMFAGGGILDLFLGNRDDDIIYGEDGIDLLFGNKDKDLINGGNGPDLIMGNKEEDTVIGGPGSDIVLGNKDNDHVFGGNDGDKDRLFGNRGFDDLHGCNPDKMNLGSGGGTKNNNDCTEPGIGAAACAMISGRKLVDRDGNGTPDGGLGGIRIYLDTNNNGAFDSGEPNTLTRDADTNTVADVEGNYAFMRLPAGTYNVREVLPDGFQLNTPSGGVHTVSLGAFTAEVNRNFFNTDLCRAAPDGLSCDPSGCQQPGNSCLPTAVAFVSHCQVDGRPCDSDGDCSCTDGCAGVWRVVQCDCTGTGGCHIELAPGGGPVCVGSCPGGTCELMVSGNVYTCQCVGMPPQGADLCVDAQTLPVPSVTSGTTIGATPESPSPQLCGTFAGGTAPSVWYKFVGTGATVTASLCGSGYDTVIHAYCRCMDSPCITGNDDFCGAQSQIVFCTAPGVEYYLRIAGFGNNAGAYTLTLSDDGIPCADPPQCNPAPDPCTNATVLEDEPNCGNPTDTRDGGCDSALRRFINLHCGDIVCGTTEYLIDPPTNIVLHIDQDWYTIIIPTVMQLAISLQPRFDADVILTSALPCPLTVIAQFVVPANQSFTFPVVLTPGEYHIGVIPRAVAACGAQYVLSLNCQSPAPPPSPIGAPPEPDGDDPPPPPAPNPPVRPLFPHDVRKNRYISFVPGENDSLVAYEVTILPCRRGWVGEPLLASFNGVDPAYIAQVVDEPVFRDWREDVVHVYGCPVAPAHEYEVRAVNSAGGESTALALSTVAIWGDCVGVLQASGYTAPNGVVDEVDIQAIDAKIAGNALAPHVTWVDLSPELVDYAITPGQDRSVALGALSGEQYPPESFASGSVTECPLAAADRGACCSMNAKLNQYVCEIRSRGDCQNASTLDHYWGAGSTCGPNLCQGTDCNSNGTADFLDVQYYGVLDCNTNGRPDSCEPLDAVDGETFTNPPLHWSFRGAAAHLPQAGVVRLVRGGQQNTAGVAFFNAGMLSAHFEVSFQFTIANVISTITDGANQPGPDGLCFFVTGSPPQQTGGIGRDIGYGGFPQASFAVEFDAFQNPFYADPDSNHVALNVGGWPASIASMAYSPNFESPGAWRVRVVINGAQVQAHIAPPGGPEALALSAAVPAANLPAARYIGFSSGTGLNSADVDIDNVRVRLFENDCDSNGTPDVCDVQSSGDPNGNGVPDSCESFQCLHCPGDLMADQCVDSCDIQPFVNCLWQAESGCACADMNGDGTVNAADVALFTSVLLRVTPPAGACADCP